MGAGTLTLSGTIVGLAQGQQDVNVVWSLPNAEGTWLYPVLAAGETAFATPSGATTLLIIPPDDNVVPINLKMVSGETGLSLHPTLPTFISLSNTATSVILAAAAPLSGAVSLAFW